MKQLPWYIALAAFLIAAGLFFCWIPNDCEPCGSGKVVRHEVDSTGADSSFRPVFSYVPEPKGADTVHVPQLISGGKDTLRDTVPRKVDTSAIVADYLRTRFYKDTVGDSTMRAIIADSVRANRIVHRSVAFKNLRPTRIDERTIVEPRPRKTALFLGAWSHFDPASKAPVELGPELNMRTKGGALIGLGTDLIGDQPNVKLSASFRLRLDSISLFR